MRLVVRASSRYTWWNRRSSCVVSLDKIEAKSHEQIEKRKQSRQSYPTTWCWMYLISRSTIYQLSYTPTRTYTATVQDISVTIGARHSTRYSRRTVEGL